MPWTTRWRARPTRRSGRSTSSRITSTTTWRSSSTNACAGGRWCCRWSSRSEPAALRRRSAHDHRVAADHTVVRSEVVVGDEMRRDVHPVTGQIVELEDAVVRGRSAVLKVELVSGVEVVVEVVVDQIVRRSSVRARGIIRDDGDLAVGYCRARPELLVTAGARDDQLEPSRIEDRLVGHAAAAMLDWDDSEAVQALSAGGVGGGSRAGGGGSAGSSVGARRAGHLLHPHLVVAQVAGADFVVAQVAAADRVLLDLTAVDGAGGNAVRDAAQ